MFMRFDAEPLTNYPLNVNAPNTSYFFVTILEVQLNVLVVRRSIVKLSDPEPDPNCLHPAIH